MAKNSPADWDPNADNNTDIGGVNIGENCPPSGINNAIRTLMAQIIAFYGTMATAVQMWVGTSTTNSVSPKSISDAAKFTAITDAATITPDHQLGRNFYVNSSLGGNRTLAPIANAIEGEPITLEVKQDATGNRSLTVDNTKWLFPNRVTSVPLSTAANAIDLISGIVRTGGANPVIYANVTRIG